MSKVCGGGRGGAVVGSVDCVVLGPAFVRMPAVMLWGGGNGRPCGGTEGVALGGVTEVGADMLRGCTDGDGEAVSVMW